MKTKSNVPVKVKAVSATSFPLADFPRLFDSMSFPCLEPVAATLLQTGLKNANPDALDHLLLRDPLLVAKILGRGQRADDKTGRTCVISLREAIGYLGTTELIRMLEREPLSAPGESPFHRHTYLLESIGGALIAQQLADFLSVRDPALLTSAAILRDVGKPLQQIFCTGFNAALNSTSPVGVCPLASEREILGIDHVALGTLALKRWNLPNLLVEVVRQHHEIDPVSSPRDRIASLIVQAADSIFRCLAPSEDPFDYVDDLSTDFLSLLDEARGNITELINQCRDVISKLRTELRDVYKIVEPKKPVIAGLPPKIGYLSAKAVSIDPVRLFATSRIRLVMNFPLQQIALLAKGGTPCLINLSMGTSTLRTELLDKLTAEKWRGGLFIVSRQDHEQVEGHIRQLGGTILVTPFHPRHFDELLVRMISQKPKAA